MRGIGAKGELMATLFIRFVVLSLRYERYGNEYLVSSNTLLILTHHMAPFAYTPPCPGRRGSSTALRRTRVPEGDRSCGPSNVRDVM
jgi:hypothetical protein